MDDEEKELCRDLVDVMTDIAEEKAEQRLNDERHPNLDAIRWMALGMAIADKHFHERLFKDVGERAFGDDPAVSGAALVVKSIGSEMTQMQIERLLEECGFEPRPQERLSAAILRLLASEDEESWECRNNQMWRLAREMAEKAPKLASLCRLLEYRSKNGKAQEEGEGS